MLRPPHPLDNGGKDADASYRAQLYEIRRRQWYWRINNTVLCVVAFCTLVAMAVLPVGLPLLGNLAWATDIDRKVQNSVEPIQRKLDSVEQKLSAIAQQQEAREINDLRQKIFDTRVAQCKARAQYNADNPYTQMLRDLRDRYYDLVKANYDLPNCSDL